MIIQNTYEFGTYEQLGVKYNVNRQKKMKNSFFLRLFFWGDLTVSCFSLSILTLIFSGTNVFWSGDLSANTFTSFDSDTTGVSRNVFSAKKASINIPSKAATKFDQDIVLTASEMSTTPEYAVDVSWKILDIQTYKKDWIGIVPKGKRWSSGMSWFYTKGEISGSNRQISPNVPGEYEAVYYKNNGFTELARSNVFTVEKDSDKSNIQKKMLENFCTESSRDIPNAKNVAAANKKYEELGIVVTDSSIAMSKKEDSKYHCNTPDTYQHWSCDMKDIDSAILSFACDWHINKNTQSRDRANNLLWLWSTREQYISDTYQVILADNNKDYKKGIYLATTPEFTLPLPDNAPPLKLFATNGKITINATITNTEIQVDWSGIDNPHKFDWIGIIPKGRTFSTGMPHKYTGGTSEGSVRIRSHDVYYVHRNLNGVIMPRNFASYHYDTRKIRRASAVMAKDIPINNKNNVAETLFRNSLLHDIYTGKFSDFLLNSDYMHTLAEGALIYLMFFEEEPNMLKKGLNTFKLFLEQYITPSSKRSAVFKPDGTGHHHYIHYNAYMYALNPYISLLTYIGNSKHQISQEKYNLLRGYIQNISIMSNSNDELPSIGGRHPFNGYNVVWNSSFKRLIALDEIFNISDKSIQQLYDYKVGTDDDIMNCFWQFNYGSLGIYRNKTWLAGIAGCGRSFKCGETSRSSSGKNMYGRYQRYGTLMMLYRGNGRNNSSLDASGFTKYGKGWDWNKWPGATSIILPWNKLIQKDNNLGGYTAELNKLHFSGALRFEPYENSIFNNRGDMGVFGMDFQQREDMLLNHDESFKFKKSVFFFDGKILMLGSNIENQDSRNETVTTLFQNHLKVTDMPISLNESVIKDFPYSNTIIDASDNRLIDAYGTGYLVKSHSPIKIERKEQHTPSVDNRTAEEENCGNTTTGSYQNCFNDEKYVTAVIEHGVAPNDGAYEYVVIPDVDEQFLSNYDGSEYAVLRKDSVAHIVRLPENITGYVIFKTDTDIEHGNVTFSNKQVLVMEKVSGDNMNLTVVNPYLNFHFRDSLSMNPDTKSNIRIVLRGIWALKNHNTEGSVQVVRATNNETEIFIQVKDGLPADIELVKATESMVKLSLSKDCA